MLALLALLCAFFPASQASSSAFVYKRSHVGSGCQGTVFKIEAVAARSSFDNICGLLPHNVCQEISGGNSEFLQCNPITEDPVGDLGATTLTFYSSGCPQSNVSSATTQPRACTPQSPTGPYAKVECAGSQLLVSTHSDEACTTPAMRTSAHPLACSASGDSAYTSSMCTGATPSPTSSSAPLFRLSTLLASLLVMLVA